MQIVVCWILTLCSSVTARSSVKLIVTYKTKGVTTQTHTNGIEVAYSLFISIFLSMILFVVFFFIPSFLSFFHFFFLSFIYHCLLCFFVSHLLFLSPFPSVVSFSYFISLNLSFLLVLSFLIHILFPSVSCYFPFF